MAQPAVQGDVIQGMCTVGHTIPSASGAQPAPPLPFVGPLQSGLVSSVTIGGRPVAVVGSSGDNTPPHPGLFPGDPVQVNVKLQVGKVLSGSPTVTFGGKAAATSQSQCKICGGTATIKCTTMNVTVA